MLAFLLVLNQKCLYGNSWWHAEPKTAVISNFFLISSRNFTSCLKIAAILDAFVSMVAFHKLLHNVLIHEVQFTITGSWHTFSWHQKTICLDHHCKQDILSLYQAWSYKPEVLDLKCIMHMRSLGISKNILLSPLMLTTGSIYFEMWQAHLQSNPKQNICISNSFCWIMHCE